jgi:Flp pilus assembly protein TadD
MYQQAIAEFERAASLSGGDPEYESLVGYAYAMSGNMGQARRVLDDVRKRSKEHVPAYGIALIYMGLGEKAPAFEWLQKAYEDRSSALIFLKVDPMLNGLRTDPRFAQMAQQVRF